MNFRFFTERLSNKRLREMDLCTGVQKVNVKHVH